MFRQIPVQNKICFQREHERNVHMHDIKIRNMKKMIDNEAPAQYDFLISRKKKEALQQSRGNEIQRENKILIHKLTQIMNRSSFPRSQTQQNLHGSQGSAFSTSQYSSSMFPFNSTKNSLNQSLRKKEFVKIVIENQALLKRIQSQRSEYNVRAWEKERQKNEKYISQISEYQYKDFKPNKTHIRTGIWRDQQNNTSQLSQRPPNKLQPLFKNKNSSKIIYKNGKKIGSFIYLVEIKVQAGFFIINLENLQKQPNMYKIELTEEEGMNILFNECNNDPELLIERIRIDEKTKSFYFKRNIEFKSDSLNTSQQQASNEHQKNQNNQQNSGSSQNIQQNKANQLRVTEEREEEDEQSILNSKAIDQNSTAHKDQNEFHQSNQKENHEQQHNQNNQQGDTPRNDNPKKEEENNEGEEEEEYEEDNEENDQ